MAATLFSQDLHGHLLPYIAALHAACITGDKMAGPFLPPLKHEKLLAWWKERIAEATRGARVIVLLFAPTTTPTPTASGTTTGPAIRGIAMLKLDETETGPFRAEIDAVLVQQGARRQGCGRALVGALEAEAGRRGRSLLLVHVESDSIAETAFVHFGYTEIGRVPQYSRFPPNGKKPATFFYKDLSAAAAPAAAYVRSP
ncbi:acetyltransferase [Podospora conica]|nr:acetyltransferase [Schizothecium conicum]